MRIMDGQDQHSSDGIPQFIDEQVDPLALALKAVGTVHADGVGEIKNKKSGRYSNATSSIFGGNAAAAATKVKRKSV